MNNFCFERIQPSLKLKRMITFLKLIVVIHIIILSFDLFFIGTAFIFILLFQLFSLIVIMRTKYFGHYLSFILFILYSYLFILSVFEFWFKKSFLKKKHVVEFCYFVFLSVFEIFLVYVLFQVYKQTKYEYRIQNGFAGENDEDDNNIQNANFFNENHFIINNDNNN